MNVVLVSSTKDWWAVALELPSLERKLNQWVHEVISPEKLFNTWPNDAPTIKWNTPFLLRIREM